MDSELRMHLLERLAHRSKRLATVASGAAPDPVIAMMARHVTETAMVLLGEAFTRDVLETLFDTLAESHGICRFCHARPRIENKGMCQVCWDTAASDDEITDEEIAAANDDVLSASPSAPTPEEEGKK